MQKRLSFQTVPPVVISGTMGSGTRLVAEIVKRCGGFIGRNVNADNDNMDFAFCLSGRVWWAATALASIRTI